MSPKSIFISAGESSGDLYASELMAALRRHWPEVRFFGCAGPRMQQAGVEAIVDARSLAVAGLVEVVAHIPRIYGEYRKLLAAIRERKPDLVILTDSPDFHLRVAAKVRTMGIPVYYLVAPQAWAWRSGRTKQMRRDLRLLFCLFPFEEGWYRARGVAARYIGHPLARIIRPKCSKQEFFERHGIRADQPMVALCPGSRRGEMARHLPVLVGATRRIREQRAATFVLAVPLGFTQTKADALFWERIRASSIQVIEGETWDVLAHADLALAASGTVTMEAALLGTPMVTFYRVTALSWLLGKFLVRVPHYSMVNLIAQRRLVPELMQNEMNEERVAAEASRLLTNPEAVRQMREGLREVAGSLVSGDDPMEQAARIIRESFDEQSSQ